jgi:hypothetical protein
LSYEFHRSHRRRHSAGYHRLNLFVPLSLLLESARFIRRTVPCDENYELRTQNLGSSRHLRDDP